MSERDERPGRLIPWADSETPGDLPAPLDRWLAGDEDYQDLPAEEQWAARCFMGQGDPPVQTLFGVEATVRFRPGDRFSGRSHAWLIDRLVLSPQFGRFQVGDGVPPVRLTCHLDGEEIDVLQACGGVPLGPGVDVRANPVATIGAVDSPGPGSVGGILYSAGPWLISASGNGGLTYLPVPTNEMGVESDYRRIHEAWVWVEELAARWARSGAEDDLAVVSEFIDDEWQVDVDEMLSCVTEAARGGRGIITFNGRLVYAPGASR